MTHWTKEVASILAEKIGFEHPILDLSNRESLEYGKSIFYMTLLIANLLFIAALKAIIPEGGIYNQSRC